MSNDRIVVAITGASGAPYALNLVQHLSRLSVPMDLIVSPSAGKVLAHEIDPDRAWVDAKGPRLDDFGLGDADVRSFDHGDFTAAVASGTALRRGMVVIPCSMGTVGRIAAGVSTNLIDRAADVCLKERRRLVLVAREAPLSAIHLANMTRVTDAGAVVLPAAPGFYHRPQSLEQLIDHVSAKVLDVLGIEHDVITRWGDG